MGTSSSFGGPKENTPLLPPFANNPNTDNLQSDNTDQSNNISLPTGDWPTAKKHLGRLANGTGSSPKKALKSYVNAYGGSNNASRSAKAGKIAIGNLGSFLGNIASNGLRAALRDSGLEYLIGKPTETVLVGIANKIAPIGKTNEDAVARNAILDALNELYLDFQLEEKDIDNLDNLNRDGIEKMIKVAVRAYIYERYRQALDTFVENKQISINETFNREKQIKEYIDAEVDFNFSDVDILNVDFNQGKGRQFIEDILEDAYSTLEK